MTGGRERSAPAGPAERRVRAFRVVPEGRAPRGAPARSVHGRHSRFFVGRPGTGFLWCQQVTSKNGSGNPFRCSGVEEKETCPPKVVPPCTWQSGQSRRRRHLWLQPGASSRERLASLRWLGKPLSQRPPGRLLGSGRPQGSAEKPEPLSGTAASPVSGLEGASESSGPWTWACRVVCTLGASYIISAPHPLELTQGRSARVAMALVLTSPSAEQSMGCTAAVWGCVQFPRMHAASASPVFGAGVSVALLVGCRSPLGTQGVGDPSAQASVTRYNACPSCPGDHAECTAQFRALCM